MQSPRSPSGHTESLTHAQRTRSPEPKFTRRSTLTNGARKAEADAIPGDADLGTHSGYQRHVARTGRHPRLFRCTCLDSFGTSLAGTGLGRPCPRLGPNVRVRPPPRVRGPSGKTAPKAKRPGDQERGSWTLLWGFGGSQAAGVGLFWGPGRDSGPAKLWGSVVGALRVARQTATFASCFARSPRGDARRSYESCLPSSGHGTRVLTVGKWEAERRDGLVPRRPC